MHALPTFMEIASQLHAALDAAAGRLASGSHVGCSLALLPDVALRGLSHHWGVVELVGQGNSFQLVVGVGKEILVEAAASILGREHKQEGGMGANNNKLPLIGPVVDCLAHDTTALLLLLFPAHNSLWNARRRWLTFNVNRDSKNGGHGGSFLLHELLLTSLLVSFHHKMQEVWVHRWWVVQRLASRNVICAEVFHQHDRAVLLEASDKHRMNYHSWNYRRQAVTFYLLNTQGGSGGSALALSSITLLQEEVDTTIRFFETHNGDASAVSYLTFLLKQSQTIDSSCVFVRGMWAKLMTTTSRELRRHCDKGHEAVWVLRLALVHWAMKVRLACGWTLQDELDFVNLFAELPQWPCAEHVLNDRVTWEGVQGSWRGTSYYAAWYGSQLVKWLRAPF
ncbi:hypothetical protein TRVL_00950 [Trypanosoma vivax]|uniref:Uncharacterized protein n=1 Tax=Trypanosoma vivax (strain Y486) TaxID=1055687 RepID=G0U1M8_TRYVY|nr:hypothetical protein TRVL_00950 [Trypanosoma vivax]CCC49985.1 conserved hypothetical protein [Trypanosoma vivax Y486]